MILFRADGNAQIGSGHIMRSLSIADAFRVKQISCLFVLADKRFQSFIEDRGYETCILDSDYRDMDAELEKIKQIVCSYNPQMIIFDSYYVTRKYLQELKSLARLIYIDDLASFAYPVDVLVNYNAYGPNIDYNKLYFNEKILLPKTILGIRYAPLREMFQCVSKREQSKEVKNILVSTGGADSIHLALRLVQYIACDTQSQAYHFLVGAMNSDFARIKKNAEKNSNIHIHHNVKNMKSLISSCDLAVSAAGSTMYEIAACGVPMITYVLADNQIYGAEAFDKLGLAVSCGDLRNKEDVAKTLMNSVDRLVKDFILRKQIGEKMQHMVDGFGANRLVEKLLEF